MPKEPETVTFTKVVPIADADGVAIREGSVLREITDGEHGVVTAIGRSGSLNGGWYGMCIGDLLIQKSPGCCRVTNRYDQWRHVPHDEQTYEERLVSWLCRKYEHYGDREVSEDEGKAVDGIMALLPDDTVDWDYGPTPDRLEDALAFLKDHLQELQDKLDKQKR